MLVRTAGEPPLQQAPLFAELRSALNNWPRSS